MTVAKRQTEIPHQWPKLLGELTGGCLRPGGLVLTSRLLSERLPADSLVLEIGCGNGRSLSYLREELGLRAVGLDLSAAMLEGIRANNARTPLVRAQAAVLPIRDASLDAVLCECVLSLMPSLEAVLDEIVRVLRPGGLLLCTDLYARFPSTGRNGGIAEARCCIDGAITRVEWLELLQTKELHPEVWEDHSRSLTQLAGELIFAYGSLESFWRTLLPAPAACEVAHKASVVKPGYSLTVARKR